MSKSRHIPQSVKRRIGYFSGKNCKQCGRVIDGEELLKHLDHILPVIEGGEGNAFNIQQLCHECNLAKGDKITTEVKARMEKYWRRQEEIALFFNKSEPAILGNDKLREPQRGAYLALQEYFSKKHKDPAIVEIPTGAGKTGIICLSPFGIAHGRILVVTPNITIKDTVEKSFSPASIKNFYLKACVFPDASQCPKFVVLKTGYVNEDDCLNADIVIGNVQQIQSWLDLFPSDFFDMVIVDEAHHAPANSWQKINSVFPHTKKIYLTATPFRSDKKRIVGQQIYKYTLADAMKNKYTKHVKKVDAVPSKLTFTIEGETKEYGYDEIMRMRDESWFSRGVALSEAPNISIADKSIQILREKRKNGIHHQVIAVACSIRHAEQLVAIYNARQVKATFVHSEMPFEQREKRIEDFERGEYDCIIHVGILGEGYDHPPISVAAIFRPFRTLAPYAQFIGRSLRVISDAKSDIDNIAHAVSHIGLNLDQLWEYFKTEQHEAEVYGDIEEIEEELERELTRAVRGEATNAEVTEEVISRYAIDTFLPDDPSKKDEAKKGIEEIESRIEKIRLETGAQLPSYKEQLAKLKEPAFTDPVYIKINRPDLERHEYRSLLDTRTKKLAGKIILGLGIDGKTNSLVSSVGKGEEKNNYEVVIRLVNRTLNEVMGKDGELFSRNDWGLDELKDGVKKLDTEVEKKIVKTIKTKLV